MNDQIFESHGWVFDRGWHRRPLQIKRGKIMVQLSHVLLLCTLEVWDVEETLFQIEVHLKFNFVKKTFSVSKISTLKKVQFWNAKGDILILSWISRTCFLRFPISAKSWPHWLHLLTIVLSWVLALWRYS